MIPDLHAGTSISREQGPRYPFPDPHPKSLNAQEHCKRRFELPSHFLHLQRNKSHQTPISVDHVIPENSHVMSWLGSYALASGPISEAVPPSFSKMMLPLDYQQFDRPFKFRKCCYDAHRHQITMDLGIAISISKAI